MAANDGLLASPRGTRRHIQLMFNMNDHLLLALWAGGGIYEAAGDSEWGVNPIQLPSFRCAGGDTQHYVRTSSAHSSGRWRRVASLAFARVKSVAPARILRAVARQNVSLQRCATLETMSAVCLWHVGTCGPPRHGFRNHRAGEAIFAPFPCMQAVFVVRSWLLSRL